MTRVMLKCKQCGGTFFSGIDADSSLAKTGMVIDNEHQCSLCKQSDVYSTTDYFFEQA